MLLIPENHKNNQPRYIYGLREVKKKKKQRTLVCKKNGGIYPHAQIVAKWDTRSRLMWDFKKLFKNCSSPLGTSPFGDNSSAR